jgi:spore coat protein JB
MSNGELKMLNDIQALDFTAFDFNLYLDTHPNDPRALAEYSKTVRESRHVKSIYNSSYGPLTAEDNIDQRCWRWIEEPWPWEIDY